MNRRGSTRRWRRLRQLVFARDGRRCAECGRYADTIDHIKPLVLGGANRLDNLRPLCRRCNCTAGGELGRQRQHRPPSSPGPRRVWPGAITLPD